MNIGAFKAFISSKRAQLSAWWKKVQQERKERAEGRRMLNEEGGEAVEWERAIKKAEDNEPNEFRDMLIRQRNGYIASAGVSVVVLGLYGALFWAICHP